MVGNRRRSFGVEGADRRRWSWWRAGVGLQVATFVFGFLAVGGCRDPLADVPQDNGQAGQGESLAGDLAEGGSGGQSGTGAQESAPATGGMPGAGELGGEDKGCDTLLQTGCEAEQACAWGEDGPECVTPGTVVIGEACIMNAECAKGLTCFEGSCGEFCGAESSCYDAANCALLSDQVAVCAGNCEETAACCADIDCELAGENQQGSCTQGQCEYQCAVGYKACPGSDVCIPDAGCCSVQDCSPYPLAAHGRAACVDNSCSYSLAEGWVAAGDDHHLSRQWAEIEVSGVRLRMVYIEPGTFMMGSPEDEEGHQANENLHEVTLTQPFWLATTETTQDLWQAVTGENPSQYVGPQRPVTMMWRDDLEGVIEQMNGLVSGGGLRLPTEAEWEYACRAGDQSPRYGELDAIAWYADNTTTGTQVVGSKAPNAWGLYDMLGNVVEWCADRYVEVLEGPAVDPVGPNAGQGVGRGAGVGSGYSAVRTRAAARFAFTGAAGDFGFRLARSQP